MVSLGCCNFIHPFMSGRLMRAFTGREKLIKFVGCYHGHADSFLVQAGSGVATLGLPDSPGVPAASTGASLAPKWMFD